MTYVKISADRFGPWALVTGASSGIGREFARQLAANGLHVVLAARRTDTLAELGAEIESRYGVRHLAVTVDLSDASGPDRLAEATSSLDVGLLVSNAGDLTPGEFLSQDLRHSVDSLQLNAYSHLVLARVFGGRLADRGRGGVVLVGAAGAEHGIPWLAAHAAAKAYTNTLGRGLHAEFAARGVTVTVLAPGPTRTELQSRRSLPDSVGMTAADCVSQALRALAAGRGMVVPGVVARVMNRLPASLTRRIAGRTMAAAAAQESAR
ncbi:SDR family NAD(P)-dependent oxidoreductase [Micromonospora sp. WMMD712]|uniref:SDR family NAD(P)-dependent oxidoreductase n=1 Tax=Micromonospora sp. WMMD712 TaxID=3016096 RepID=UPI002499E54E|nr:SDR family NAD(P)-dependent oxidoreductase [Micromonospora sp. WMMD712]WFE56426.1 SDR family NAD(P)-dependent oxidoreductase [Micromonospora sp. WMMD712]